MWKGPTIECDIQKDCCPSQLHTKNRFYNKINILNLNQSQQNSFQNSFKKVLRKTPTQSRLENRIIKF